MENWIWMKQSAWESNIDTWLKMAHFGHLKCCTIDHNVQTYRYTNVQWSLKLIEVLESQDILRTGGNLSAFPARMKEVTQKKPDWSLKWICRWSRVTMEWRPQARLGGLGLQPGHWTVDSSSLWRKCRDGLFCLLCPVLRGKGNSHMICFSQEEQSLPGVSWVQLLC